MKNQLTEQELVSLYRAGNQVALEELITRHKNRVYTYILMIVKNQALAEDIFQDTFIKIVYSINRGTYTDNGKFISWAMRIAHNLIIDHFRKAKNLNTISNESCENDIFNHAKFSEGTIEDQLITNRIHYEVRELVQQLPKDQKQVVFLRHYQGLSFKEIAEQTNVSINTALGRMRYAILNLRRIAEEKGVNLKAI